MSQARQVAIVSGSSRGIGRAIALELARRGMAVVVNYRSAEAEAKAVAGEVRALGVDCLCLQADVADPDQARGLIGEVQAQWGRIDVLVNNAGIFDPKPVTEYQPADIDALVSTNLKGFFYATQQAVAHMTPRRQGHIVSITASIASQPNSQVPASLPILIKGGINHATKALALELAPHNIKVSAVAPGIVDTPLYQPEMHGFLNTLQPAGRIGTVQEIADAVLYLTDAEFTTGVVLPVDGGMGAGKW
jgi:NAD(P)-dependent dehydrogenase (short-subunit alcohol dehydrogenase family)